MADGPGKEENANKGGDEEKVILIRHMEWTEWLPMRPDEHMPDLTMASGITAVRAGKDEKLVEIGVTGTGRNYQWFEDEDGESIGDPQNHEGPVKTMKYGCYAYQAIFAQEVSTQVAAQMRDQQAKPMVEEMAADEERQQNPASKLVITDEKGREMRSNRPKVKKSGKKQQPRGGRKPR